MAEDVRQYPPHCQMMRNALREKDWQQDIVAAVMAQSRSTVNTVLTGRRLLTARLAIDYGHLLSLSPEELLRTQGAWELETAIRSTPSELSAIRARAREVDARLAGDRKRELEALRDQRTILEERIARLAALETATPPD